VAELRFCAYQYQHLALDALQRRWRDAERLGFDVLWNCDTVVEPDRCRHTMFDGPATLTMMAAGTNAIRVGTLVSSLYFRHPVTLAKAVMTVDHLSGGRVEVALGVGDPSAGAMAAGVDWSPGTAWGGYGVETEEDFYAATADRSHRFDDLSVAAGRDPAKIRHSLVCFPPLTPWLSVEYFRDMVGRFAEIGIDEFVLYWPQTWREAPGEDAVFEEVATTLIPRLRGSR